MSEAEILVADPTEDMSAAEELERIAKNDPDGLVQPHAVVAAAQDLDSPLHQYFEWDNALAGHAYRLQQARQLIVRVNVRVVDNPPAMVNVKIRTPDGVERRGYLPTVRAVVDPDMYTQVVADAERGIRAYRNRLSAFHQARGIVAGLDTVLAEIESGN
jgi:hypothetical protein